MIFYLISSVDRGTSSCELSCVRSLMLLLTPVSEKSLDAQIPSWSELATLIATPYPQAEIDLFYVFNYALQSCDAKSYRVLV